METTSTSYEYTIDEHKTRAEVRVANGEWSAYVFVDPVTVDGRADLAAARDILPKVLKALAGDLERG